MQEKSNEQMPLYYSKSEILEGIKKEIEARYAKLETSRFPSAYNMAKIKIFKELLVKAEKTLFLALPHDEGWSYIVYADEYGARIELICGYLNGEQINLQRVIFAEVKAQMLDSEAYGKIYNVGAGSVRQWIRRGKLPNAMKVGSVWLISELALPKGRGYDFRVYIWDRAECRFEEEMAFLNEYDGVSIEQKQAGDFVIIPRKNHECGYLVNVYPQSKQQELEGIAMNQKQKESFELKLIENPFVKHKIFSVDLYEE